MTEGQNLHFRPLLCQTCGLPLERLWSLYIGYFWGTRVGNLGPGECRATTGPWGLGYGPHTPPDP